jgi:hypothetical protein
LLAFPHLHFFTPVLRKQRVQKNLALTRESNAIRPHGEGCFATRAFSSTVFHSNPNLSARVQKVWNEGACRRGGIAL